MKVPQEMFDLASSQTSTQVEFCKPSAVNSLLQQDMNLAKGTHTTAYGHFVVNHPLSATQCCIMRGAEKFYRKMENLDVLASLITQSGNVSLRLLDWLVTTLAKSHHLYCDPHDESSIYEQYKLVLSRYKRRNFDPFRRCKRRVGGVSVVYCVVFDYSGAELKSTVGQLNFVKWCIESGVYMFARNLDRKLDPSMKISHFPKNVVGTAAQSKHVIKMW
jgi:hypothetical protein